MADLYAAGREAAHFRPLTPTQQNLWRKGMLKLRWMDDMLHVCNTHAMAGILRTEGDIWRADGEHFYGDTTKIIPEEKTQWAGLTFLYGPTGPTTTPINPNINSLIEHDTTEKTTFTHGSAYSDKHGSANPVLIGGLIRAIDATRGGTAVLHRACAAFLLSAIHHGYSPQSAVRATWAVSAKYPHLHIDDILCHGPGQHLQQHWKSLTADLYLWEKTTQIHQKMVQAIATLAH